MMKTLNLINLILCAAILCLGGWGFAAIGNLFALYIGLAFGLFGLTHLAEMFGYEKKFPLFLMALRVLAYLMVFYTLYSVVFVY